MKKISLLASVAAAVVLSGCSSKQYFEPKETFSASSATHSYGSAIVDLSRDGATLKNGRYIGTQGLSSIDLGEGYRYLSENDAYVLAANSEGILRVIDKKTKEPLRAVSLHIPVVSAEIQGNVIAYVLNNNTFGIYTIEDNTKVFESRSEETFAIDTRAASPMFIDSLAVMPMLDGKLIIVDPSDAENAKVVYISSAKAFNNVIYLDRMGNTMVAATPSTLITLGGEGKQEYRANISEVAISEGSIYLFSKEGEVKKLTSSLEEAAQNKFKFAHFSAAAAFDGKVYALDQKGSLIVLSSDLKQYKIYDVGEVEEPAFIAGKKLYIDGDAIELSKLGY
ncbi:MAG: hypothetical protein IE885_01570 [Campylobacterales bacterium]|nr:hypothetical protein [Campylobacterales bacterium]